ncbi:hypothetical protein SCT_3003 [Sulfuricella sp. T08]|uniref:competence protein ComJ n=1 Tax=Sulfuricella sp. T08 TaxID=1632857 RepID=UPI0006179E73|nr:competence protein ComJ [Sulfuricella sp. T08]GAO37570.1 hypothetical protein SCT_3003 [Sulfuricella sp. T08]
MSSFDLYYSYAQVAAFSPALDKPFNDWSDRHVKQGFTWREKSASFRMLEEEGVCRINVVMAENFKPTEGAKRAFVVPFDVDACGVEVGSISDSHLFDIPAGHYALYFETGQVGAQGQWAIITFMLQHEVEPQVLIEDSQLCPTYPLEMRANPA